jgi:hypothetical protein
MRLFKQQGAGEGLGKALPLLEKALQDRHSYRPLLTVMRKKYLSKK